jgi:hypothetical protein
MHGLKEKLICLPDGTLVDGYTRFKILGELGVPILPYMVEIRDIPEDKIKEEVFAINIARRHLPDTKKIEWAQRYMPIFKEKSKPGPKNKKDELRADVSPQLEGEDKSPEPTDTHPGRVEQAKAAGVGETQLKHYNWCEKWIPELLEEGKANGEATETIYKKGQEMKKLCQKYDLWEDVESRERSLADAYETAKALEAALPPPQ